MVQDTRDKAVEVSQSVDLEGLIELLYVSSYSFEIDSRSVEREQAFDVLLILRTPCDGLEDDQVFWLRDRSAYAAESLRARRSERLELERKPRTRHIDVDTAIAVSRQQDLIFLRERHGVCDARNDSSLGELGSKIDGRDVLPRDRDIYIARQSRDTASDIRKG